MNLLGDIFNAGDNVKYQEDYRFTGSYFNISPTVIDDYTKKKLMNMQLEKMISQRNIQDIDKQSYERNQINMIDEKVYDERNQIDENDEYISTDDIEVFNLVTLCSKGRDIILKNNLMKEIR